MTLYRLVYRQQELAEKGEKAVGGAEEVAKDTVLKVGQQDLEEEQEKGWEEEGCVKRSAEREAQGGGQCKEGGHKQQAEEKERHAEQEQFINPIITFFFLFLLWYTSNFGYSPET